MTVAMSEALVFRWLLDVDKLWTTPLGGDEPFRSTETWATGEDAQYALDLLTPDEKSKVLRFYRHNDAKLSLGSCLLKRRAVVETCAVPWEDVVISQDSNKKPFYRPKCSDDPTLEFNVSHHGTLVALAGCSGNHTRLGVDIVKINWERDFPKVQEIGFEAWADVYEMVFSDQEVADITSYMPAEQEGEAELVRARLRHFYVHWCLKEAYIKMTGKGLLEDWLKELEFRNVKVPAVAVEGEWGEICSHVEIWFSGEMIKGVSLEIQAFREDYMIATCASTVQITLDAFNVRDIERDVYPEDKLQ